MFGVLEIDVAVDELSNFFLTLDRRAGGFVFDSCKRELGESRYLIAGFEPRESFELFCRTNREARAALRFLDEKLAFYQSRVERDEIFGGGLCVTVLAYEFGLLLEDLSARPKETVVLFNQPSATLQFYETLAVHDYQTARTFIVGRDAENLARLITEKKRADICRSDSATAPQVRAVSNFTKNQYLAQIERIQRHIQRGDIYQANLTQQFRVELAADQTPAQIFTNLRQNHPAPFAAFVQRQNDCVISASPERLIKVENPKTKDQRPKTITASPIKGTRRRGANAVEDELLRRELLTSAKDRAENTMIVDLLRNDLGRVCECGTVRAAKLCEIETHETLFHLVSTVTGILREDIRASDLVKAVFPCGSITGAPKISAMQIIDRLETAPRNVSMGAIGYCAFDGSLDLNVAIRTLTVQNQTAVFNVGGGIIADSVPADEYEETLVKAEALLAAVNAHCDESQQ